MAFNKRLFVGGADDSCKTDTVDAFGDSKGIALYSLDYDASDTGGSKDGTPSNITFGVEGKVNTSARFNGTDSYISLPNNLVNSVSGQLFSFSFWFNSDDITRYAGTFSAYDYNGANHGWTLYTGYGSSKLRFLSYAPSLATMDIYGATTLSANTWYHVVVTYDGTGGTCKLYLNGGLDGSGSTTGSRSYLTNHTYYLGGNNNGAGGVEGFYKGELDQVRVFSKALSATEISTIYAETACTYTATTTDNDYPTTNLAYYKLDNSAEDEKGSSDGTATDVTYAFGKFGQAAVFNGSSGGSQILIPDAAAFSPANNDLSFSVWVKTTQTSGGYIFSKQNDGTGVYETQFFMNSNGTLQLALYTSGGSGVAGVTTTATVNDGNWHNVVFVIDTNTSVSVYVDTAVITSSSWSGTMSDTSTDVGLGYGGTNMPGNRYNGSLDQVRFFATALSASQVTELYNEKPATDTSNFKTVLYEGNSSSNYISNVGFEPDMVWIKRRDSAKNHRIIDTVRGAGKEIYPNLTNAELDGQSSYNWGFEANGFSLNTSDASYNVSGGDFVAWCWKGGGDAVTNNDGAVSSTISANTSSGFSIVKWSGDGTTSQTVGHGLSSAPEIVIMKSLASSAWYVLTTASGSSQYLQLESTAQANSGTFTSTSTTFTNFAYTGDTIAYCWHSVAGYSKVSTYSGTGTTTGNIVTVGFEPRFLLIKSTTLAGSNWIMLDKARTPNNPMENDISANTALVETAGTGNNYPQATTTSTTFQCNTTDGSVNRSGETYIYIAFK